MNLKEILSQKYGDSIVEKLYQKGRVLPSNGILDNASENQRKPLAKEQMLALSKALNIHQSEVDAFKEEGWGFDFSGWLGQFDEGKGKEIMVVGSEPHITCASIFRSFMNFTAEMEKAMKTLRGPIMRTLKMLASNQSG